MCNRCVPGFYDFSNGCLGTNKDLKLNAITSKHIYFFVQNVAVMKKDE